MPTAGEELVSLSDKLTFFCFCEFSVYRSSTSRHRSSRDSPKGWEGACHEYVHRSWYVLLCHSRNRGRRMKNLGNEKLF